MIDVTRTGILTLIRSSITGEALPLPEGFDVETAFPIIKSHGIVTMAYDGAVKCGISKHLPVMQQMFQLYIRQMLHSEGQLQAVQTLCDAFDANGIDHMPLKGCNMKKLYPKPELRPMGDADILIRMEQYDAIRPILEAQGYEEVVESDHELIWNSKALHLELHKRVIPSYNKDYYAYFGDGWLLAKPDSGNRFAMSPEDTFVYLFTHFAKHYRDGGIGLRHVTDLWVYRRAVPVLDETYIRTELDKLQLAEFFENTLRLMDVWFRDGSPDEKTDFMAAFIFGSGNWGQQENHDLSAGVKDSREAGSAEKGRRKHMLRLVFPPLSGMQQSFPVLKKAPVLLPAFWGYRGVRAVLFRQENIRRQQEKLRTVTPEKINSYRQALNYVGLDFHFKE